MYLSPAPGPGLVPMYRCALGQYNLLTSVPSCEAWHMSPAALLGYAASSNIQATTRLYRMYNPSSGDHFYTTNAIEFAYAKANYGYWDEGVPFFVWWLP